jgi:hypothetical protein
MTIKQAELYASDNRGVYIPRAIADVVAEQESN